MQLKKQPSRKSGKRFVNLAISSNTRISSEIHAVGCEILILSIVKHINVNCPCFLIAEFDFKIAEFDFKIFMVISTGHY